MERFPSGSALKSLEKVLTHGGELAKQLQLHLNAQPSSQETLICLLNEILTTYDRAFSLLEYGGTGGGASPGRGGAMVTIVSDSPGSPLTGSPHSNRSDQEDQANRIIRGYDRCTHEKGCLARTQVQRLDEDPAANEVTYKGLHTCHYSPPIPITHPHNEIKAPLSHENQQEPFLNIQTSLKIIDSGNDKQYNIPSSSNFIDPENNTIFSDDHLLWEDDLLEFMNPTAPELNFLNDYKGLNNNLEDIESVVKPANQDVDSSFDSSSGQLWSSFGFGNSSHFP